MAARPAVMPTIAITGAGGFLGSELVNYFASKDWQVIGLVRSPSRYSAQKNVRYTDYDLGEDIIASTLEGVDYVVHAAYIKQDSKNPKAYATNVRAAKALLAASREAGVKRNIFISSMSAHAGAVSSYGKQKLAIERLFSTEADLSLRLGLIVGNGGLVRTMTDFMKSKRVVPLIGGGRQPLQIINVSDVSKVIEQAINVEASGVLTVANPNVYTYKQFYVAIAKHLGIRVLFVPTSFYGLLLAVKTVNLLRLPVDINSDNVLGLKKLISVDTLPSLQKLNVELDDLKASLDDAGI